MSLRSDDLDSVGELYSEDDFRQLVVTVETTPAFLGGLGELEDHGERGLVRETTLGAHGAVAHRCERAFDDVGCAQMLLERHPGTVELVEVGGARTVVAVPMLKENELIGAIVIYRQEVRPFSERPHRVVPSPSD